MRWKNNICSSPKLNSHMALAEFPHSAYTAEAFRLSSAQGRGCYHPYVLDYSYVHQLLRSAKLLEHKFMSTDGKAYTTAQPVPRRIGSRAWILPMSLGAPAVDHKLCYSKQAYIQKRRAVLSSHTRNVLVPPALREAEKWQ